MNDLEQELKAVVGGSPFIARNLGRLFQQVANTQIVVKVTGGVVNDNNKEVRISYILNAENIDPATTLISPIAAFKTAYNRIREVAAVQADPDNTVD